MITRTELSVVEVASQDDRSRRIAEILAEGVCTYLRREGLLRGGAGNSVGARRLLKNAGDAAGKTSKEAE